MPRNLVALYNDFLEDARQALELPDVATTRSRLYSILPKKPLDPRLADVLAKHNLGASYARTHLLSIGSWPKRVQEAIAEGLPYKTARQVAKLPAAQQVEALRVFTEVKLERPDDASKVVEDRLSELKRKTKTAALKLTRNGWVVPAAKPKTLSPPSSEAWVYPELSAAEREDEALHANVIGALLSTYVPAGGRIVDVTAGTGTVARVGHELGYWVWSGDLAPQHPFIHAVDATDISIGKAPGLHDHCANMLIIHPPSFPAWQRQASKEGGLAEYEETIAAMLHQTILLLCQDGYLVLIIRPVRNEGCVRNLVGDLSSLLEQLFGCLTHYHLAVEQRGLEAWHILVAKKL